MNVQGLKSKPHPVMVTAYGREDVLKNASGVGIAYSLTKPVNSSLLFDSAIRVLGGETDYAERHSAILNISSEDLASIRGARVLLVEDNELNQQVALELLAQAGFETELAENGEIGVEKVKQLHFDAVLMDMQMPVMDGETATREIRKDDRFNDLPILAMTANAMEGDREKCIEAGMNDHIAKPIDPDDLFGKLLKWIPARTEEQLAEVVTEPETTPSVQTASTEVETDTSSDVLASIEGLDTKAGLRNVANNREFYERLLRQFITGSESKTVETVREQIETDRAGAERTAHSLKGVAGTIGATELQGYAQALESAIHDESDIEVHLTVVDEALTRLIGELQSVFPEEAVEEEEVVESTITSEAAGELVVELEGQHAVWEKLSETLSMNDIEDFANQIKNLGDQYDYAPLTL
ncbi:MAG: response regulator [Candidatus Latescibacteria bacterium]|nr:response regulator [Candidatus Latescibacterota bacterium]